jgi:CRP/FNR family cyclic AMP-dependent transcriptional regulator
MERIDPLLLRRYSLFGGLMEHQLARLSEFLQVERVATGAVIVNEGDHGDRLYCIHQGRVAVRKRLADGSGDVLLAELQAGDTVGEMELIDLQPRTSTVIALEPCVLLGLRVRDILALSREDLPGYTLVVMNLARDLSRRLRKMDERAVR